MWRGVGGIVNFLCGRLIFSGKSNFHSKAKIKRAGPKERGAGLTRRAGLTRGQILGIDLMNEACE